MKNRIKIVDSLVEFSGAAVFITLYLLGEIGLGYAVLGVVVSLSVQWPFSKTNRPASL
jgi:hypothetical protein